MNISEARLQIQTGQSTALSLLQSCLARIESIDRAGPALNAVIELNPDAEAIAAVLDEERLKGLIRGPLHGIPILLKDNIDTHDRMTTTSGSLALEGSIAPQDAFLVSGLRRAGAVILGKANLSEWANFRSSHSVSGWSSRGGQTKNPYVLDRSPCGSSSGSAVAVAADLCLGAVGTETDGSVICPAQTNGIVGLKPTLGLISRSGVIPISHSQDTAGPMGRSVMDVAILLSAMTGIDPEDSSTAASAGKSHPDYTVFLKPGGQVMMHECRIGGPEWWQGVKMSGFLKCMVEKIYLGPGRNKLSDRQFDVSPEMIAAAFGDSLRDTFSIAAKGWMVYWGYKR